MLTFQNFSCFFLFISIVLRLRRAEAMTLMRDDDELMDYILAARDDYMRNANNDRRSLFLGHFSWSLLSDTFVGYFT